MSRKLDWMKTGRWSKDRHLRVSQSGSGIRSSVSPDTSFLIMDESLSSNENEDRTPLEANS
jgi:hypothetical protein